MGLKIVYGKSGTGKTEYCFKEVKNKINENKKIYIILTITPTPTPPTNGKDKYESKFDQV